MLLKFKELVMIIEKDDQPYFELILDDNCFVGFTLRKIDKETIEWLDYVLTNQFTYVYNKSKANYRKELKDGLKPLKNLLKD